LKTECQVQKHSVNTEFCNAVIETKETQGYYGVKVNDALKFFKLTQHIHNETGNRFIQAHVKQGVL
jgi:hypothetical protein